MSSDTKLYSSVYNFYTKNFGLLPPFYAYHFCSRMVLWSQDDFALKWISNLNSKIENKTVSDAINFLKKYHDGTFQINYDLLRKPFFDRYPIRKVTHQFFTLLFLDKLHKLSIDTNEVQQIWHAELAPIITNSTNQLLSDQAALQILSTFAVNYFTLLSYQGYGDLKTFYSQLIETCQNSNWDNYEGFLARKCYFFSHIIIGSTLFYTQLPDQNVIAEIEKAYDILDYEIRKNYDKLFLDIKLEYLVCQRILKVSSLFTKKIIKECENSVSDQGKFLVDKHAHGQQLKIDFVSSEHRNVLFLMQSNPWKLHEC